jgi:hypothetical protein
MDLFGVCTEYAEDRRQWGVTIITTIAPALHKENQFTQYGRRSFETAPVAKSAKNPCQLLRLR